MQTFPAENDSMSVKKNTKPRAAHKRSASVAVSTSLKDRYAAIILERLAAGETLRAICRTEGFPVPGTVLFWQADDPEFSELYARARRDGLDVMAEQIVDLADNSREGVKTEEKQVGWRCPKCHLPVVWQSVGWRHSSGNVPASAMCEGVKKPEKVVEIKTVAADMVDRSRLQVDARKWLLSKLRPDKYGDRVQQEISGPGGGPVQSKHEIVFVKPEGK